MMWWIHGHGHGQSSSCGVGQIGMDGGQMLIERSQGSLDMTQLVTMGEFFSQFNATKCNDFVLSIVMKVCYHFIAQSE